MNSENCGVIFDSMAASERTSVYLGSTVFLTTLILLPAELKFTSVITRWHHFFFYFASRRNQKDQNISVFKFVFKFKDFVGYNINNISEHL